MEVSGGKNSLGKNNAFLQGDRSTFAYLVQTPLYSCGLPGELLVGGTFPEKRPLFFFCLRAEKDNCSSELTQDASLAFQRQHKLLVHSWRKSYVDLLSRGVYVCARRKGNTERVRARECVHRMQRNTIVCDVYGWCLHRGEEREGERGRERASLKWLNGEGGELSCCDGSGVVLVEESCGGRRERVWGGWSVAVWTPMSQALVMNEFQGAMNESACLCGSVGSV